MGKVVTREWRKAKSAKLEFAFVSAFRDNSSFGLNILGPLCLWQCLCYPVLCWSVDIKHVIVLPVFPSIWKFDGQQKQFICLLTYFYIRGGESYSRS